MNIPYWIRKPWYGVGNVVRWTPVIWVDFDWDYSFLLKIMEYKLGRMAKNLDSGITVNSAHYARKARIAAELCKRINNDDYWEISRKLYPREDQWKHQHAYTISVQKQDQEMLGLIFTKYLRHWWD